MIVVSGRLYVDAAQRHAYLEECREVARLAREAPGCVDFHLSADPLEADRINIFEQWESVADVETFRGSGPSSEQQVAIRSAEVWQHEIASSTRL